MIFAVKMSAKVQKTGGKSEKQAQKKNAGLMTCD